MLRFVYIKKFIYVIYDSVMVCSWNSEVVLCHSYSDTHSHCLQKCGGEKMLKKNNLCNFVKSEAFDGYLDKFVFTCT